MSNNNYKYKCSITKTSFTQKSHLDSHLKTTVYKLARKIKKLELEKLDKKELEKKYKTTDIEKILNMLSKMNYHEIKKRKLENKLLWIKPKVEINEDKKYLSYKSKLDSIIKRCHDILYSNGSIVGDKARDDIIRLLTLKLLEHKFNDKQSDLYKICLKIKKKLTVQEDYNINMDYCKNFKNLAIKDDFKGEWEELIQFFRNNHLLENIYAEEDQTFNCTDPHTLKEIINIIDELKVNQDFINSYGTSCGDIHEMFATYGGKASSKTLGAFYTPRKLIDLIIGPLEVSKLIKESDDIYDPCMGTGGFLTRTLKQVKKKINIHGCETALDTIKFGYCSVLLTTGKINENLEKCDSLCQSKTLISKKYDGILTNPPFGTKQTYGTFNKKTKKMDGLHGKFNELFPDSDIKFKDIYPIKCNNGACLFIQNCIYKLKEGGFCAIVLPDGELFEGQSKWSKKFRKWWCENVNITKILKVPGGTFEHAGVKTNVVVFKKNGPTKNIEFLQTTKQCDSLTYLTTISKSDLKASNYSLDLTEYLEEEDEGYEVPMVKLGDVCNIDKNIKKYPTSFGKKSGKYRFYTGGKTQKLYCDDCNIKNLYIIQNRTNGSGKCNLFIDKNFSTAGQTIIYNAKNNDLTTKYIYYYFNFNIKLLEDGYIGSSHKNFSKSYLEKLKIPLPSLEIQQQIVDRLSKIEHNISTIQQRIKQLGEEKDFYKEFGRKKDIKNLLKDVEKVKLGYVCNFKGYVALRKKNFINGNYPVIGGGRKPSGYHNQYNKEENTILCSGTGSYAGYISKYPTKVWASESFSIHPKDNKQLSNNYLYYYLVNNQQKIYTLRPASGGQPHMYGYILEKKLKIPVPSLKIQQQLIQIFEQKEQRLKIIQNKIESEKKYVIELKELAKDIIYSYC